MPPRMKLLAECDAESLSQALKGEIENLPPGALPLERALTQGGRVEAGGVTATVISLAESETGIRARVGIFFDEIVGGCSCGDEPFSHNVFCEMQVDVDRETAEAAFTLIEE
jgi:hypothetical protein